MPVRADISVYRRIMNRQLKAADIELFAAFCVCGMYLVIDHCIFIKNQKVPIKNGFEIVYDDRRQLK